VRRLLRLLLQLTILLLAAWFVWRVLRSIGWRQLREQMARTDPWWAAAATVLLVLRFVVWDLRWRLSFRRLGDIPRQLRTFFSLLGSACANTLTPSAHVVGGLLRARHVAGPRHSFGRVFGVIFFDQMVHQLVLIITGWVAFIGMAFLLGYRLLAAAAAAALLVAMAIFARWTSRLDEERVETLTGWAVRRGGMSGGPLQSVLVHGSDAVRVVRQLLEDASLRRSAVLLTLLFVVLNALAQWALFRGIGFPLDFLTVLLGVTAGAAAGAFTGSPGGAGTTEAGMILAYVALEVPKMQAGAATLLYRGLHYLVVLALGLPALAFFEAQRRRRPEPLEELACRSG
jgi:uncharacterized protein (TIRG00374 family)